MAPPTLLFFRTLPSVNQTKCIQKVCKLFKIDMRFMDVALHYNGIVYQLTVEGLLEWDELFFADVNTRPIVRVVLPGDTAWLEDHLLSLKYRRLYIAWYIVRILSIKTTGIVQTMAFKVLKRTKSIIDSTSPCEIITYRPYFLIPDELFNDVRSN